MYTGRKKYLVLMHTKKFGFIFETNSFKLAKRFADLRCFRYAKIEDNYTVDKNEVYYGTKTIYINDRRA